MRRCGETREHTYRMILLDPLRSSVRETSRVRAHETSQHAHGNVVVFRKQEESSEGLPAKENFPK